MNSQPLRRVALACAALFSIAAAPMAQAAPAGDHPAAVSRALAHLQQDARSASGHGFEARDVIVDADGVEHVRFTRRFQGLRVIGGDVVVHSHADGALRGLSRTLASAPMLAVQPKLKAADAEWLGLAAAHVATGATVTSELVVFAHDQKPALAWDVLYTGQTPEGAPTEKHVIVHAHTGKVLDSFDDVMHAAAVGTGHSLFLGTIDVDTDSQQTGGFALRDTTRGGHAVYDLKGKFSGTGTLFTDADNEWGDGTKNDRATVAVDAAAGHAYTWDYYLNVHGRHGIADDGKGATSKVHQSLFGLPWVNASWSDSCFCMSYGDGDASNWPLVAIDVAGHEMSHGVTSRTANLTYSGESGGLNESTSDIFGSMVEFYANIPAETPDYLIGERLSRTGAGPLRTMIQPSVDGASADCWYTDLGKLDVHYSSGVGNHFFYMLANGSQPLNGEPSKTCQDGDTRVATGTADVKGVGRKKAEKIWYRALSVYMTSSTNYHQAREATLAAAADLYGGVGSKVWNKVNTVWAAVNVK
ncbi:M4 family metallopeptidase [Ideonella sp.]|uniref:M4 family metallopeptidase n=1 Tax=Ideonella sp. TaxID=1929293 RepID=UPI0035B3ABD3